MLGKGLHSKGGVAKLKPAIEELIQKYVFNATYEDSLRCTHRCSHRHQLIAQLDPQNAGVLIVSLDGRDKGTGRVMQPDDITRGIESKDEGCVIM